MACFLVPAGEAIITTVVQKVVENSEEKSGAKKSVTGLMWSRRLGWLNKMLWGGVILLALEHIWHGEVVPWPPFLTAMSNPEDTAAMLRELSTIGVAMALFVTVVWAIMVIVAEVKVRSQVKPAKITSSAGGA